MHTMPDIPRESPPSPSAAMEGAAVAMYAFIKACENDRLRGRGPWHVVLPDTRPKFQRH